MPGFSLVQSWHANAVTSHQTSSRRPLHDSSLTLLHLAHRENTCGWILYLLHILAVLYLPQ